MACLDCSYFLIVLRIHGDIFKACYTINGWISMGAVLIDFCTQKWLYERPILCRCFAEFCKVALARALTVDNLLLILSYWGTHYQSTFSSSTEQWIPTTADPSLFSLSAILLHAILQWPGTPEHLTGGPALHNYWCGHYGSFIVREYMNCHMKPWFLTRFA
jgi:hypothetical protein